MDEINENAGKKHKNKNKKNKKDKKNKNKKGGLTTSLLDDDEKTPEELEEEKHGVLGKILRAIVVANTWV